jgi:predicted nucleic acid-binding protein
MKVVDTSVWIDHFRRGDSALVAALEEAIVCTHPYVMGELACGNLKSRSEVLSLLQGLPQVNVATNEEVLQFIEQRQLMGCGIGYVDAALLAACALEGRMQLWTRDKRLAIVAADLGLLYAAH